MGKKYIIELKKNETLYKAATRESDGTAYVCSAIGTPYTEPDLDAIKQEEYEKGYKTAKVQCDIQMEKDLREVGRRHYQKGYQDATVKISSNEQAIAEKAYQRGLNDAWEAARKVVALSTVDRRKVFGTEYMYSILEHNTASEAIEKIRQYEQEKQEKDAEIKVGKEFQMGERKCVVTHIIDGTQRRVLWDNGVSGLVDNTDLFVNLTPTGRHFPEIAAVLEKMRGEQDG